MAQTVRHPGGQKWSDRAFNIFDAFKSRSMPDNTTISSHNFNFALEVWMATKTVVMGILEVLLSPDLVPMSLGIKLVLFHMD